MVLDIDIEEDVLENELKAESLEPLEKSSEDVVTTESADAEKTDGDPASDNGYVTNDTRFETVPSSSSSTFGTGSTAFTNTLSSTSFGGFDALYSNTQPSSSETNQGSLSSSETANGSRKQAKNFEAQCYDLIEKQLKEKIPENLEPVVHSICSGLLGGKNAHPNQFYSLKQSLTQVIQHSWNVAGLTGNNSESSRASNSKSFRRKQSKDFRLRQSPYYPNNTWVSGRGNPNYNLNRDNGASLPDARSIIHNRLQNKAQVRSNQQLMKTNTSQASQAMIKNPSNQEYFNPTSMILTQEQMDNPLTTIVTDSKYPEVYLTSQQFELFKIAVRDEIDKTPVGEWPKFETSFCKGGVFIFIAAESSAQDWLRNKIDNLKPWNDAELRVSDSSILIKMIKVQTSVTDQTEEPSKILERLQLYNPTLQTKSWIINSDEQGLDGRLILDLSIPETELPTLESLDYKPFYDLGRLNFQRTEFDSSI
ncbi:hypothetical protein QAD02_016616 [Eretmocerus hayati]|uniref:Uncharacterized protein n=1 Tax=Eretmocerus hayati TaxID=131215 RepID=A0ACC2PB53_9HYME|nr:hypothetical protein QAD02_016616 [Eretmocerus hayati]